jgi:hypothetical protein
MSLSDGEFHAVEESAVISDIHSMIADLHAELHEIRVRQDALITSHNEVGANVAWIVANTQGLFKMFNDPGMMNQVMSMMGGGILGGPKSSPGPEQPQS